MGTESVEPQHHPDMSAGAIARPLVQVSGLSKEYPGTLALDGVDFDVRAGEIHALCGGNGSGKSTMIKILAGVEQGEPGGTIRVGDVSEDAAHVTPAFALQAGVRVVHQDLGVFPDMTVAENIVLGTPLPVGLGGRIKWSRITSRAAELIERLGIEAKPHTLLRDLNRAGQTEVAIARALQDQDETHSGLLILDEPTTSLPAAEVDLLLTSLRRFADVGQSIVYVSHRLDEILKLTDRLTVLRDGRLIATHTTSDLDETGLVSAILGRPVDAIFAPSGSRQRQRVVLEVSGLKSGPLRDVSLSVKRGEIVGVAGLLGSGRSRLLANIFGAMTPEAGSIAVNDHRGPFRHQRAAMNAGIALVPENRGSDAAFHDLSLENNMTASVLSRYWRHLHIRDRKIRADSAVLMTRFGVKAPSTKVAISTLSGGNQQKAILARWLRREPAVLLLDEPTQGVDVGARAEIYRQIREAADGGMSVLLVASDFDELAAVADRAVVLRNGRIVGELSGNDLNSHRLNDAVYQGEMHNAND
jgi:ribose transport system ATP-binding protein